MFLEMSSEGTELQAIVYCHERFELYGFIFMRINIKKKAGLDPNDDDDDKTVAITSFEDG